MPPGKLLSFVESKVVRADCRRSNDGLLHDWVTTYALIAGTTRRYLVSALRVLVRSSQVIGKQTTASWQNG